MQIIQTGHLTLLTAKAARRTAVPETLPSSPWAHSLHTSSSSLMWCHHTTTSVPWHLRQVNDMLYHILKPVMCDLAVKLWWTNWCWMWTSGKQHFIIVVAAILQLPSSRSGSLRKDLERVQDRCVWRRRLRTEARKLLNWTCPVAFWKKKLQWGLPNYPVVWKKVETCLVSKTRCIISCF